MDAVNKGGRLGPCKCFVDLIRKVSMQRLLSEEQERVMK